MRTNGRRREDPRLTPPRIAGCVPRERLFLRLDQLRRNQVVWIWGPSGAKKSMLLASYVDSRQPPALWFQVDQEDRDPATFF